MRSSRSSRPRKWEKARASGSAQVYGFMRSAGGDVTIESEVGKGTTVRLFFPRSAETAVDNQRVTISKVPLRRATSGETVLLVDDDEEVLRMAVESLEELHYNLIVSCDATEALQYLTGDVRIDIMFSDVVMPGGMNGAQLAVEARKLRPDLKILLTSGYVGHSGVHQVLDQGLTVLNKAISSLTSRAAASWSWANKACRSASTNRRHDAPAPPVFRIRQLPRTGLSWSCSASSSVMTLKRDS